MKTSISSADTDPRCPPNWLDRADDLMGRLMLAVSFMALPLVFLLFAQWPLRDLFQAYSRQANDLGQILFALYVAAAITAASRGRTHLASGTPLHAGEPNPKWQIWAVFACTAPWAIFMLWTGWSGVVSSVQIFQKFSDTGTPGYFLISISLIFMLLLVVLDGLLQIVLRRSRKAASK